jgi:glycerophosphoryl diester phosphodiesterase
MAQMQGSHKQAYQAAKPPSRVLIAHRGWSRRFPENSLPAFAAAIAAGADEMEFDVRVSRDNVPFICHDKQVDRVSSLMGLCSSFTMQELQATALKAPDGSYLDGMGFPTLMDVLELFGSHIGMNVHIKDLGQNNVALHVIAEQACSRHLDGLYIAGNAAVLEAAHDICPEITRCCLDRDHDAELLLESAIRYGCQRLQYFHGHCEPANVQDALAEGLVPNYYFVDTPSDAEHWLQAGVTGLLTNNIGPMRQHFKRETVSGD